MSHLNAAAIGLEAPRFVALLVKCSPDIEAITLFRPPSSLPIQQDPAIDGPEQILIERALAIRSDLGLPFWDSLLLYVSTHSAKAQQLLKRATLHNPQHLDALQIHRDDCTESRLLKIIEALPSGRMLAISSRMLTKQNVFLHLPMLDFHCPASPENDTLVRLVVAEIGLEGYIARSGRSYHFYGNKLVDEQSLIAILAKALLFSPIIDRAWIAHQLLERACGLRISPGKDYENCPVIISEV
jgi:hypothetical protein